MAYEKLSAWMQDQDLKDEGLAARLEGKLSRSQIGRIRNGASFPKVSTARILERETGIPAAKFITGEASG